ncbi:glycolate oxidase subunit GlcF [Labrys sp. 22185]|uniref:glycolate oxidase subunit GlcF n=1 Tax=Labrys sp. 22185 TaxID=3453888 RepID=UPI003F84BDD8
MQTNFSPAQLADPHTKESEQILRTCVHCGFCTATCPTYVLLGDELDSPRGRIYLIKDMLEGGKPATAEVVKHVDRCLSCLSCMTTCPSGVNYMHLVDHARAHIDKTYRRPASEALLRTLMAKVLPNRRAFRWSMALARLGRPFAGLAARLPQGKRLAAMLALAPASLPSASSATHPGSFVPKTARKGRVALLTGCAQAELAPGINEAAIRLLNRHGIEVVLPKGEGCCGALVHHMGKEKDALAYAKANIDAWTAEMAKGLDAILITTSGCGTTIKDYGFMLRGDPAYAQKAAAVSAIAKDISEYLETLPALPVTVETGQNVTYHAACSLQHGQQIKTAPKTLLKQAGFVVKEAAEAHLCCGSAGTYNMLQPEISERLRERKLGNIAATRPQIIAAGNIGCMTQLAQGTTTPIVHTVELLDWATGGPKPRGL